MLSLLDHDLHCSLSTGRAKGTFCTPAQPPPLPAPLSPLPYGFFLEHFLNKSRLQGSAFEVCFQRAEAEACPCKRDT